MFISAKLKTLGLGLARMYDFSIGRSLLPERCNMYVRARTIENQKNLKLVARNKTTSRYSVPSYITENFIAKYRKSSAYHEICILD